MDNSEIWDELAQLAQRIKELENKDKQSYGGRQDLTYRIEDLERKISDLENKIRSLENSARY